jgi:hypothetical protein
MCQRHWVWRDSDPTTRLYFHDATGPRRPNGEPVTPRAYVLFVGNRLLNDQSESTGRELVEQTLAVTELEFFRRTRSLIYQSRPHLTKSVSWAASFPTPDRQQSAIQPAVIDWRDT